jgi:hypothetical protein
MLAVGAGLVPDIKIDTLLIGQKCPHTPPEVIFVLPPTTARREKKKNGKEIAASRQTF